MPPRKHSTKSDDSPKLTLHASHADETDLWLNALESVLFPPQELVSSKPRNTLLRA